MLCYLCWSPELQQQQTNLSNDNDKNSRENSIRIEASKERIPFKKNILKSKNSRRLTNDN